MPAQPLSADQRSDAARLKAIYLEKKRELGLTQEALAAACEWDSQGTVSQYLNGKIPLNLDAALKFSRELRCSVESFSPSLSAALPPSVGSTAPRHAATPSLSATEEAQALAREAAHIASLWLALDEDQRDAAITDMQARSTGVVPASVTHITPNLSTTSVENKENAVNNAGEPRQHFSEAPAASTKKKAALTKRAAGE